MRLVYHMTSPKYHNQDSNNLTGRDCGNSGGGCPMSFSGMKVKCLEREGSAGSNEWVVTHERCMVPASSAGVQGW